MIKIDKSLCLIKEKYVYIPREVIVKSLKKQPGHVAIKPVYLTRQDVERDFFLYFKEKGLSPAALNTFIFLNANRNKTGKKLLTAYAKLLDEIKQLLDKYGSQMLNEALLVPKDSSLATISYLKGILRNMAKKHNATEQPSTGKITISHKNLTIDNVGTYINGLTDKARIRLALAILQSLELIIEKQQFNFAWQEWKKKKFANDFTYMGCNIRSLVVDFIKVKGFLKK